MLLYWLATLTVCLFFKKKKKEEKRKESKKAKKEKLNIVKYNYIKFYESERAVEAIMQQ